MSTEDIYIQSDEFTYIRVEPTEVAREIESLKLVIQIAEEKIAELHQALRVYREDSEEFENGMDQINDVEMAVAYLQIHLERLVNIPRSPQSAVYMIRARVGRMPARRSAFFTAIAC